MERRDYIIIAVVSAIVLSLYFKPGNRMFFGFLKILFCRCPSAEAPRSSLLMHNNTNSTYFSHF